MPSLHTSIESTDRAREARLRRAAAAQGFKLQKSRRRDWSAGLYGILDVAGNSVVVGFDCSGQPDMDLDEIEHFLAHGFATTS